MIKYAVFMNLPEGKIPGYYAQVVKALANKANLFDRDKEVLIVHSEDELKPVIEVMEQFKIDYEIGKLWLLPESSKLSTHFSDFGFTSKFGNTYLYEHLSSIFYFTQIEASNLKQALYQIEEHKLAEYSINDTSYYAVEKHLNELMERISKAYDGQIEFIQS
ncbi:hypothetical protein [Chengkuizengella axinellae]|uniref:Uncharacterized protein n=1 Tax=Chengkuizengella axinellae TaxID=3064388 RepID=A0ABT9IWE3_9BACL|nr:hypothetical protein [Chengkuizengella sp. 2205SS18-9]MDP5273134.1 hypothetical protein [Chengkuizengella sp. 2205SS18-9]